MSLRVVVTSTGLPPIDRGLTAAAAAFDKPSRAMRAAADWMVGETLRIFQSGYNVDGPWAPLSKMTMFIRIHRANAPRTSSMPGSDTGRLKESFLPTVDESGSTFGAGSNVEYAQRFNDGGPSVANSVAIAGFRRRNMKRIGKDYVMNLKAGHDVPGRQFYPSGMSQLASWGYLDKIRAIFAIDFNDALGGTA